MHKVTGVQAPGRLQALDGWRTVSIAGVIIAHLLTESNIGVPLEVFGPAAGFIQQMGLAGVHIFFVISGFVICRGMLREEQRNGRVSLSAFYVRRVMRIMPPLMLYAGVIVMLALLGVIGSEHLPIWRTLTFTCNLPGADCGDYLGAHTWSLSYEEQFYLIAPPLFVIASTARRGRGVWLLTALVAVAVAASFAGLMTAATFLSNFFFILTGVVCALHEETVVKALRRLPPGSFWVFVAAFLAFERLGITRFSVPAAALCSVAIAGMLMMTAFGLSRVGSWLSAAPMVSIGRVSYGVYLWQQLATFAFPGAGMAFYAASVAGCIGISYLSFFLMERPLIAVGARWSDRIIARHANRGQQA